MPDKKPDHGTFEALQDAATAVAKELLAGDEGAVTGAELDRIGAADPPGAASAPEKDAGVVMTARRPWSIGESIGLSRGYTFVPGAAIEVTAEDARILCAGEWNGRTFKRAAG